MRMLTLAVMLLAIGQIIQAAPAILDRYYLGLDPQTLRIRCEQESGGVLINGNCFKKSAVIWASERVSQ